MTVFRRANPADIPDIMRLVREAQAFMRTLHIDQWQDGYPGRDVLERDIELGQLYVFAGEDAVAAIGALTLLPEPAYEKLVGRWLSDGPYLTIHRMALDDAHRGGGLAAELLAQAERLAREGGCASVRIDTHRGNLAMRRFVEKHGFVRTGEHLGEVGHYLCDVLYIKDL